MKTIGLIIAAVVLCTSVLQAEIEQHLVRVSSDRKLNEMRGELGDLGKYLSVKCLNIALFSLPDDRVHSLKSYYAADYIGRLDNAIMPAQAQSLTLFEQYLMGLKTAEEQLSADEEMSDRHSCGGAEFFEAEQPLRSSSSQIFDRSNPSQTSEVMIGTTAMAIFFVHNTEAERQRVPAWDSDKEASVLANVTRNLAWWALQASHFGKEKSFEIVVFSFEDTLTHVDFDPSQGYSGISDGDPRFQMPIMEKAGYREANVRESMRRFVHDLRVERNTDWGFLAFILEGAGNVRAHASFNGPSTVLMRSSAANGNVFAHEVGHIFGAFDEYWEAPAALFRSRQSRFGVPNANFHWRNYPVQPSIMATNFSGGMSYYTAAHLGLTDSVRYTTISPTPESAIFEVIYRDEQNRIIQRKRHQGSTRFHWGAGMSIEIIAFEEIESEGQKFTFSSWNYGDRVGSSTQFSVDEQTPSTISLLYAPSGEAAPSGWSYLTLGDALASDGIYGIASVGRGAYVFAGDRGGSYWDGTTRQLFDVEIGGGREGRPVPAVGDFRAAAADAHGRFFLASQQGIVVTGDANASSQITFDFLPVPAFKTIAVTDDGSIYTAVGLDERSGGRDGAVAAPSGLFIQRHRAMPMRWLITNSNLPSNFVSGVAAEGEYLWTAFQAPTEAQSGLYRYDMANDEWLDFSFFLNSTAPKGVRVFGSNVIAFNDRDATLIMEAGARQFEFDFPQNALVFDVAWWQNKLVVASNRGVFFFSEGDEVEVFNVDNSPISSNFVQSLLPEENRILMGTREGVSIFHKLVPTSVSEESVENSALHIRGVYPSPLHQDGVVEFGVETSGEATIHIIDMLGRTIHRRSQFVSAGKRQQLHLPLSLFPSNGVFILQISHNNEVRTSTFVVSGR